MAIIKKVRCIIVSIDTKNKIIKLEKTPRQATYRNGVRQPSRIYEYPYSPELDIRYSDDEFHNLIGSEVDVVLSDDAVVNIIPKI